MTQYSWSQKIRTIKSEDFNKIRKSVEVLCRPQVISRAFAHASMNPDLEVAGLLIGPPPLGQCQIINKYMPCDYAIATVGSVKITPKDFYEIKKKIKPSEIVVGWGHSHPGYGAFISSQDYKVEDDFQAFYSDSVALVIDPFHPFNVNYGFFRIINGQVAQLPYRFLIGRLNI